MNRRRFLRQSAGLAAAGTLPMVMVDVAAALPQQQFRFAVISDAHLQQVAGAEFVRHWDESLLAAIDATNRLGKDVDFVVFGGDLAQSGSRAELEHGAELLSRLERKTHMVVGEHDYYADLGANWQALFGATHYSFDHKGVHFVVLNSVQTHDAWANKKWSSPAERLQSMASRKERDNSPFMVGAAQREWLAADLGKVDPRTPVVVLSHAPLQRIHRAWNYWTEDAPEVQALLAPFVKATVIYGHVHQVQYNRIGNVHFHSVAATGWPRPFPQAPEQRGMLPVLSVHGDMPLNRADGALERDATGWQLIDVASGDTAVTYNLSGMEPRAVAVSRRTGQARDTLLARQKACVGQYSSQSMV